MSSEETTSQSNVITQETSPEGNIETTSQVGNENANDGNFVETTVTYTEVTNTVEGGENSADGGGRSMGAENGSIVGETYAEETVTTTEGIVTTQETQAQDVGSIAAGDQPTENTGETAGENVGENANTDTQATEVEEKSASLYESAEADKKFVDDVEAETKQEDLTTVFETFWNICNTIQGLPILAIPYTFKVGGWWSLVTLIIIAVASNYTSIILVRSLYEEKDGVKIRVRSSYMDIGEAFWPNGGKWLVLAVMVIELLFVATLYPVLVGAMFAKSFPGVKLPLFAWTIIGGLALLPNTLLKNLSQVAFTSIITVVSAKIIFVSIIIYGFSNSHKWQIANLDTFEPNGFPAAVAILVSCYLAQPFVAFIESTMKRPEKFEATLNWSFLAMTALNISIGLVAGVTFYPDTDEVVTNNLPAGLFRQVVNAMAAILAFTSYTLPVFTAFDVIETSQSSCVGKGFADNIYTWRVQCLRLGMVLFTILMAAAIPYYTFLLAFVGSMTGITLEFIFPALFHMKIFCTKLRWFEFGMDIIVVFIGTLVMTISIIVSWVSMYKCYTAGVCT